MLGVRNWRNRADTSEPAVLASIAGMGPSAVAFLALGATWVNPKNLVLLLSAGQQVGSTDRPWLWGAVFLLLATAPYTLAAAYSLFGGNAAQQRLDGLRAWLVARNRLIMGIICTSPRPAAAGTRAGSAAQLTRHVGTWHYCHHAGPTSDISRGTHHLRSIGARLTAVPYRPTTATNTMS